MTTHRERLLGQARADLTALPDLVDELARTLTDRHHDVTGYQRKIVGSPAPLSVPVLHLADDRHKPGWDHHDPRTDDIGDRYGITPTLELWVKVIWKETDLLDLTERPTVPSECDVLIEYWPHIEQADWATRCADQISKLTGNVRALLGIRPEYRPRCRKCASTVIPVDADRTLTSWEAAAYGACTGCDWTYPTGPALIALAQTQEPMPIKTIAGIIGVPVPTLHRWHKDGLIAPVEDKRRDRRFDLAAVRAVANHLFGRKVG